MSKSKSKTANKPISPIEESEESVLYQGNHNYDDDPLLDEGDIKSVLHIDKPADKKDKKPEPKQSKEPKITDPENEEEKKLIVMKIDRIRNSPRFGDIVGSWRPSTTMSLKTLKERLEEFEYKISTKNATGLTKLVVNIGITGMETYAPFVGADLTGLTKIYQDDPTMQDIIEELSLKYDSIAAMPVQFRLAQHLALMCMSLNKINKTHRVGSIAASLPVEKMADL